MGKKVGYRENSGIMGTAVKFASMQGLFWMAIAVGGFQTVFMQAKGLNASSAGIVNAAASAVSIFATPFWAMLCDKTRSIKKIILPLFVIGALLYVLMPLSGGVYLFGVLGVMILIPLMSFFRMPFFSMLDNWLVQESHLKGLNYGPIRSFGSICYAIGGIITSALIPSIGLNTVFYVSSALFIPLILVSSRVEDVRPAQEKKLSFKELHVGQLFKNYNYVIFICYSFFISLAFTCDNNFLPYMVESLGSSGSNFGLVSGIRSFLEIPVLLLLKPLRKRLSFYKMTLLSATFFGLSAVLSGLYARNLITLILFSGLNGLGTGFMLGSSSNYIYSMAPDHLKATSQSISAAVSSVAGIAGNLVGGILIDALGVSRFYTMVGLMIFMAIAAYSLLYGIPRQREKKAAKLEAGV